MWEYMDKWLMKGGRTWNELFFYKNMYASAPCRSSKRMI